MHPPWSIFAPATPWSRPRVALSHPRVALSRPSSSESSKFPWSRPRSSKNVRVVQGLPGVVHELLRRWQRTLDCTTGGCVFRWGGQGSYGLKRGAELGRGRALHLGTLEIPLWSPVGAVCVGGRESYGLERGAELGQGRALHLEALEIPLWGPVGAVCVGGGESWSPATTSSCRVAGAGCKACAPCTSGF